MELVKGEHFVIPGKLREGWGFTADESSANERGFYKMYASDGTDKIFEFDGETLKITRTIEVVDEYYLSVYQINELEYVDGYIYANIWYKDVLIKIDPESGRVVKRWDLSSLMETERAF